MEIGTAAAPLKVATHQDANKGGWNQGQRFEGRQDVLGRHVSANGDYGVTVLVGSSFEFAVESYKGKPISSFCPSY